MAHAPTKPVVLLDTNFLLAPIELRVDVFSQIRDHYDGHVELVVLGAVEHELEALSKGKGAAGGSSLKARAALAVLDRLVPLGLTLVEDDATDTKKPDDALLIYAKRTGAAIASSDKDLRLKAKDVGIQVFAIQAQRRVVHA